MKPYLCAEIMALAEQAERLAKRAMLAKGRGPAGKDELNQCAKGITRLVAKLDRKIASAGHKVDAYGIACMFRVAVAWRDTCAISEAPQLWKEKSEKWLASIVTIMEATKGAPKDDARAQGELAADTVEAAKVEA